MRCPKFRDDCPDAEACQTGYPCDIVRLHNEPIGDTMDDFDKNFDRMMNRAMDNSSKAFKWVAIAWVLFILVDLLFLAGLGFVAWHFIAMAW